MTKKKQQAPIVTPIREMITNPLETSLIKTFKGVANKIETLQETSLVMTFREGVDREITPLGVTRGTHSREIIDPTMITIMIIIMIIIENILHGGTRETLEDNPQGKTREVVTQ